MTSVVAITVVPFTVELVQLIRVAIVLGPADPIVLVLPVLQETEPLTVNVVSKQVHGTLMAVPKFTNVLSVSLRYDLHNPPFSLSNGVPVGLLVHTN